MLLASALVTNPQLTCQPTQPRRQIIQYSGDLAESSHVECSISKGGETAENIVSRSTFCPGSVTYTQATCVSYSVDRSCQRCKNVTSGKRGTRGMSAFTTQRKLLGSKKIYCIFSLRSGESGIPAASRKCRGVLRSISEKTHKHSSEPTLF